jgi:hypothetical protein
MSSPGPSVIPNAAAVPPVPPVIPGFAIPLAPDGPNGRPDSQTGGVSAERLSATRRDHACVGMLAEELLEKRLEIDGRLLRHALVNNAPTLADRPARQLVDALQCRDRVHETSRVAFRDLLVNQADGSEEKML